MVSGFGGVLALTTDVPEFDGVISTSREDHSGVVGETAGEGFTGVVDESERGLSGTEIPETEGLVPAGGDSEGVISGEGDVGDEMFMTGEGFEGETVVSFLTLFVEAPDDQ